MESKVVWSEGVFIAPQHFQQLDRYIDANFRELASIFQGYYWGYVDLALDISGLKKGMIGLKSAKGVLQDGTAFMLTQKQLGNLNFKIPAHVKDSKVCLAITMSSDVIKEIAFPEAPLNTKHLRYKAFEKTLLDTTNIDLEPRQVTLAELNAEILLETDLGSGQVGLPFALVRSSGVDNDVILDESYIPPSLNAQDQGLLWGYMAEIYGLLSQKSTSLINSYNDPNTGGSTEVLDFLMLQTINRYLAYLNHEQNGARQTHPESLFLNLSKLCADLMTFLPSRQVGEMPIYLHNDLSMCFGKLIVNIRRSLSIVLEQRAIRIPLEMKDEATHIAQTPDVSLLDKASFILAVKADMPNESLRQKLPSVVKIGSVEKVRELVAYHLPGIRVNALSVAPRELPYHSGFIYFELDKSNEMWSMLDNSSGMAFHLAGEFPGLDLEFWAIKTIS